MKQESPSGIGLAVAGSSFVAYGLLRKDAAGIIAAVAGGGLVALALSRRRTQSIPGARPVVIERTITVTVPPAEAYAYWRKLENLPRFFSRLNSVDPVNGNRHSWNFRGRLGVAVRWETEILNEQPGRLFEWRSVEGSPITSSGLVRFKQKQGGRGTKIHVRFAYVPATGFSAARLNELALA